MDYFIFLLCTDLRSKDGKVNKFLIIGFFDNNLRFYVSRIKKNRILLYFVFGILGLHLPDSFLFSFHGGKGYGRNLRAYR